MRIDTILTPAGIDRLGGRDLSQTTCVVFDVLRATSSIVTGLAHGVAEIYPAGTVEEALALKARMPDAVLGGERHGDPIPGFDIGNSPLEYRGLAGRRVITTTTNGTLALRACAAGREVIAGALLNLDAVAGRLRAAPDADVLIVCAGTFSDPALEDILAAGALIEALPPADLTDASLSAIAVHRQSGGDYAGVLRGARNGRALLAKGREAEVAWCARRSRWPIVGLMRGGAVVAARVEASTIPS
jgi:2-phosphosulfolactate phosphatase